MIQSAAKGDVEALPDPSLVPWFHWGNGKIHWESMAKLAKRSGNIMEYIYIYICILYLVGKILGRARGFKMRIRDLGNVNKLWFGRHLFVCKSLKDSENMSTEYHTTEWCCMSWNKQFGLLLKKVLLVPSGWTLVICHTVDASEITRSTPGMCKRRRDAIICLPRWFVGWLAMYSILQSMWGHPCWPNLIRSIWFEKQKIGSQNEIETSTNIPKNEMVKKLNLMCDVSIIRLSPKLTCFRHHSTRSNNVRQYHSEQAKLLRYIRITDTYINVFKSDNWMHSRMVQ